MCYTMPMRKYLLPVLVLLGLIGFLYSQVGSFEFLRFDDPDYTTRCVFVFDGLSVSNICTAFSNFTHAAIWMPLTSISYMVDISLFGPGAGPHHLVNVLFHLLTAGALFALVQRLFPGRPWITFLATAFWALHPQRAEAVAWIASRKDLLCALFSLLGLHCWASFTSRLRVRAFGATVCCALACLCKPAAICFPFLAFLLSLLREKVNRRQIVALLPSAILACATGLLAIYSQTHAEGYAVRELFSASFPWRLLNAIVAVGLDLFQTFVPCGIYLDSRAVPGQFPLQGVLGLVSCCLACAAVGYALVRQRNTTPAAWRSSPLVVFTLWFLIALLPTLGLFGSFGEHARADRFLYIPSMAFSFLFAAFCSHTTRRLPILFGSLFVGLVLCCSFPVVAAYQNDYTVFSRTLKFDPAHGRALAHVASEECARFGHIDKGITLYRRSQELRPRDDTAIQLAYALMMRGLSSDYAEIRRLCAKFACDHSLDAKGMALEALGTTALRQRRWTEAISLLEDSIRAPKRFYSAEDAKLRLGAAYCNAKRPEDAIRIFEPLTQSTRKDIAVQARQALANIKKNRNTILFF